jgi:hypothetical protein
VVPVLSASWSLSERLWRRFPAVVGSDGFAVVAEGACAGALLVDMELDWWAENTGEEEGWEFGRDGSAGAIGGVVSVSFARTSVCLHVPADDAGIGRWRRCACLGFPLVDYFGTIRGSSGSWSCTRLRWGVTGSRIVVDRCGGLVRGWCRWARYSQQRE